MLSAFLISFLYLIAWLAYGYIKDLNGSTCPGIMGASTSCVDRVLFLVNVLGVPLSLLIATIGAVSYSTFGKKNVRKKRNLK